MEVAPTKPGHRYSTSPTPSTIKVHRRHGLIAAIVTVVVVVIITALGCILYFLLRKPGGGVIPDKEMTTSSMLSTEDQGQVATGPPPAYVRGSTSWLTWGQWSSCDASCGGGREVRSRTCYTRDVAKQCIGDTEQTRRCGEWDCPDCLQVCQSGNLDANCLFCICDDDTIEGVIQDDYGKPLANAQVYRAVFPIDPIAQTDEQGYFHLEGVCIDNFDLIVMKDGYITTESKASVSRRKKRTGSNKISIDIKLSKLEPPVVTEHPQSKLRNIDEDIALCCEAQGVPPPSYEWFKDDVIISSENYVGNSLLFSNLKISHSGRYVCRANNVAGAQYSLAATLTVLDSNSAGCDTSPSQQMMKLPDGCTDGSGSNYYDIGKCSRRICHGGLSNTTQCTDEQTYCCSPTSSVFHTVQCDSFEIKVKVVTGCGCNVCGKQTITIQGKAVGVDQGYPLANGYIHIGNEEVGRTTANGEFSFEIGRGRKQLALTFTDKWDYFAETVKIIPLNDESSRFYHVVLLSKQAEAVTLSGNQSSVIFMGNKTEGEVKVELEIPEQSFHTEDGSLYTEEVKASVTFYDPADPSAADVMPSDLSTRDIEGNQQALRTYGMFSTQFKDKDDNPLRVDKPMQLVIDPVEAGIDLNDIDADGKPRVRLWALNKLSGEWEDSGELQVVKAKRRKRDIEDFLIGTVTVTGYHVRYFNLDTMEDELHTCYLKVRAYKTKNMEETVQNAEVTAVTADPTKSISGGVLYYYQKGTTSGDGSVCLKTFCDRSGDLFQIHVSVKYGDETFAPFHPSEVPDSKHPAAWPQDLQDSFSVLDARGNSSFSSMKGITPRMATDLNWWYDYNWYYYNYDYDRKVDQDLGPLYWQWHNHWEADYICWVANTTENFVVLTGPERGLEEYTTEPYDWQLDEETLRTNLSWFPYEGELKRACFIKLSVGGTKTGRFKVFSYGGELDIVLGELFGHRIDKSKSVSVPSAVCIEFKCSGPVREGNPSGNFPPGSGVTLGTDKTILKIKPTDPNCQLTSGSGGINQGLSDFLTLTGVNDKLSIIDSEVTFQVPDGDINGPSTGIYSFRGRWNSGFSNALTNCYAGDDNAYSLPVDDQIDNPDQGWAFHFDCT